MIKKEEWKIGKLKDICKSASSNIAQKDIVNNHGNYPIYGAAGLIKYVDFYKLDKEYIGIVKDGAGVGRVHVLPAYSSVIGTLQYIIPNDNIPVKFLGYYLKSLKLENFSTGATIPHIYFKDYGKCKINIPPLPIQHHIVAELDALNAIINIKKQQLEELDKLAEATFYDMFGDPVENEKGWEVKRLEDNVNEMHLGPFGSSLKKEFFVSEDKAYCMVYEQKHAIRKTLNLETRFVDENKYKELKRFEVKPGDFLMSCRGTIGEIFRLPKDAPKGIIHPSLMKIRIQEEKYNPIFFEKIIYTIVKNEDVQGAAVKMAITAKSLGAKELIIPPFSLQAQFAKKIEHIENQKSLIQGSIDDVQQLLDYTMDKYFS